MDVQINIPEIWKIIKVLGLGPILAFSVVMGVLGGILELIKAMREWNQRPVEPEPYEPSTYREPHYPRKNVYRYRASSRKVK